MSSCPAKTYPLTPAQAVDIASEIYRELGIRIDLSQPSGEVSQSGFTLKWDVDEARQEVTVQVVSKPWIVPCGTVIGKLDKLFQPLPPGVVGE